MSMCDKQIKPLPTDHFGLKIGLQRKWLTQSNLIENGNRQHITTSVYQSWPCNTFFGKADYPSFYGIQPPISCSVNYLTRDNDWRMMCLPMRFNVWYLKIKVRIAIEYKNMIGTATLYSLTHCPTCT